MMRRGLGFASANRRPTEPRHTLHLPIVRQVDVDQIFLHSTMFYLHSCTCVVGSRREVVSLGCDKSLKKV
jgi:hypothetical protein